MNLIIGGEKKVKVFGIQGSYTIIIVLFLDIGRESINLCLMNFNKNSNLGTWNVHLGTESQFQLPMDMGS